MARVKRSVGARKKRRKMLDIYLRNGVHTVNEARGILGLDPVAGGEVAMIHGRDGPVPLAAVTPAVVPKSD